MKNGLKIPNYYTTKVKLFDLSNGIDGSVNEKIINTQIPKSSFNFALDDGSLTDGIGINPFKIKSGDSFIIPSYVSGITIKRVYYYKRYDYNLSRFDDRILIYGSDKKMYQCKIYSENYEFEEIAGLEFSSEPNCVCYKFNGDDVIIFSNKNSFKIYDGLNVTEVEGVPSITSMCVHGERLFVTTSGEKTSLWFSDDFNPTDWYVSLDEAGFIDFQDDRGSLLKVLSFNDYVYIFRNYGISRVYGYGDQSSFSASGLFLGSGRIFENAIIDCGNRIIYLAEDGFYAFDGYNATRILKGLDKYLKGMDNSKACGRFYNGQLFINLKINILGRKTDVVLVYNLSNGSYYFAKGLKVTSLEVLSGEDFSYLVATVKNGNEIGVIEKGAKCFGNSLKKYWQSQYSDFGIDKIKSLNKISFYANKSITIKVSSDMGSKTLKVKGSENLQTLMVGLKGTNFSLEISSNLSNTEIGKITLNFSYFRWEKWTTKKWF